jgi:hypothetical protein
MPPMRKAHLQVLRHPYAACVIRPFEPLMSALGGEAVMTTPGRYFRF